jgi:hypothetical protein
VILQTLHGRLRALRGPSGRTLTVSFNTGSGDDYAGIHCDAGHLAAISIVQLDIDRLRVSTHEYRVIGPVATLPCHVSGPMILRRARAVGARRATARAQGKRCGDHERCRGRSHASVTFCMGIWICTDPHHDIAAGQVPLEPSGQGPDVPCGPT